MRQKPKQSMNYVNIKLINKFSAKIINMHGGLKCVSML